MREADKKFIKKFGERQLFQLRRCLKLELKMYEIEAITKMSRIQIYYWREKLFLNTPDDENARK